MTKEEFINNYSGKVEKILKNYRNVNNHEETIKDLSEFYDKCIANASPDDVKVFQNIMDNLDGLADAFFAIFSPTMLFILVGNLFIISLIAFARSLDSCKDIESIFNNSSEIHNLK